MSITISLLLRRSRVRAAARSRSAFPRRREQGALSGKDVALQRDRESTDASPPSESR